MRYECNACHGLYESPLPDGTTYFHACPPEPIIETVGRRIDDPPLIVGWKNREGHRDENVVHVFKAGDEGIKRLERVEMRSPGAGVTERPLPKE